MTANDSSSSGEITSSFEKISDVFTSYSEIPSEGFNRLYKAQRYGKWFIIKGLKPEYQHKEVYVSLLTKEFELGLKMDHPNIAHIFSKETDPVAGPCIVMEYVDGVTLKAFLKQNPPRKVRMKIAKELLSAMSYYHSMQIVHRDLKPDNILITRNGHNVKIIDFGLADSDWHGVLKQPVGSDHYAAPEQKAGGSPIDCRADLYAFGKILRQLFPHAYGRIARKCTQENREKRYSNGEEILQRLQRHEHTAPIIIAIAFVIVLAICAWFLFRPNNDGDKENPNIEKQEASVSEIMNDDIAGPETAPANPVSQAEPNHTETAINENTAVTSAYNQLPQAVKRSIEQSVDAVFQPFWDWEKAATARGVSSKDKLAEYFQSDFFKNNYRIRERHREAVVSDILRQYPQCESIRDSVTTFYNSTFVNRMVIVNNTVSAWQRESR